MNLDESFLQKLHQLPPEKQREAINFIEFLHKKSLSAKAPKHSLKGLWSNLGLNITEQDITQARAECWSNFPDEEI
jgi:hypothetical protein